MGIEHVLQLLGGLGLFLFGMKLMGEGLETVAGSRLKSLLERITSHPLLGVLVGLVVTGAIQSSSATTVMVVGFLNAGLLKLSQAVYIIMGANIGTTVTSFLIGLKVNDLALVALFIGMVLMMFFSKKLAQHIGMVVVGFGILFTGMNMMSGAMSPLKDEPVFIELMGSFSNPVLGILAGAVLTAIIQSSSASVGILQALASSGAVSLGGVIYILFGQNRHLCHRHARVDRHQPCGQTRGNDPFDVQCDRDTGVYPHLPFPALCGADRRLDGGSQAADFFCAYRL